MKMNEVYQEMGTKELAKAIQLYKQGNYNESLEKCKAALWYFEEANDRGKINYLRKVISKLTQAIKTGKVDLDIEIEEEPAIEVVSKPEVEGSSGRLVAEEFKRIMGKLPIIEKKPPTKIEIKPEMEKALGRIEIVEFMRILAGIPKRKKIPAMTVDSGRLEVEEFGRILGKLPIIEKKPPTKIGIKPEMEKTLGRIEIVEFMRILAGIPKRKKIPAMKVDSGRLEVEEFGRILGKPTMIKKTNNLRGSQ